MDLLHPDCFKDFICSTYCIYLHPVEQLQSSLVHAHAQDDTQIITFYPPHPPIIHIVYWGSKC
jgi:hypothetical protein